MTEINIKIPENIIKECWTNITFEKLKNYIDKKRIEEIEKKYYNKKEDNYGPFKSSLEAISFLTRNRWI